MREVDEPDQKHKSVPGEHAINEAGIEERRAKPHQAHKEKHEETIAEGDADALVGTRRRGNFRWNQSGLFVHLLASFRDFDGSENFFDDSGPE